MSTITLDRVELVEQLQQVATAADTSPEKLLDRAVTEFLENVALQKLQDETRAFEALYPQLVKEYLHNYVAIHNGLVVDHDKEVRPLHLRIRHKFGKMPILFRQVTEDVQLPELVIRSPKYVGSIQ